MVAGVAVFGITVNLGDLNTKMANHDKLRVSVLGATGHVGRAALDVATSLDCEVVALAARRDVATMAALCALHRPAIAALAEEDAGRQLAQQLAAEGLSTEVCWGEDGLAAVATSAAADTVVAAIGGVVGVGPTMAAARAGKRILLANKEALITAGGHMLAAVAASGAELVPVDSEHGALLELLHLARDRSEFIANVWLTASGGPFHGRDIDLEQVSPQLAAHHPIWKMGQKISVDSATLMNKGLEVIEASLLFDLDPDIIKVVIHPQGIVHAVVDFSDGGSVAHCATPDMRHALARAFAWPQPHRLSHGALDWCNLGPLEFHEPDTARFPCLRLAREALDAGGAAPAILNAANEVAVAAFCAGRGVGFTAIPAIIATALETVSIADDTFEGRVLADRQARVVAAKAVARMAG